MKYSSNLLPKHRRQVAQLGERLKLARLRRGLNAQLVAERAGISRQSLTRIEAGEPNVTFSNLFQVMRVLGLAEDIDKLAMDDEMGRKLQDLDLKTPKRGPKRKVCE
jgi:transcriptional regulator with XRE-family HTH domain